jgi:hypothetical protein
MSELEMKAQEVQAPAGRRTISDRWARQLGNGVKAYARLQRPKSGLYQHQLGIAFRVEGADADFSTNRTVYVGEIVDEIVAVLNRHGCAIEWEWKRAAIFLEEGDFLGDVEGVGESA